METPFFQADQFFERMLPVYFREKFTNLNTFIEIKDTFALESKKNQNCIEIINHFLSSRDYFSKIHPPSIRTLAEIVKSELYIDLKSMPKKDDDINSGTITLNNLGFKEISIRFLSKLTVYKYQLIIRILLLDLWNSYLTLKLAEKDEDIEEIKEFNTAVSKEIVKLIDFIKVKLDSDSEIDFETYICAFIEKFVSKTKDVNFLQSLGKILKNCYIEGEPIKIVKQKYKEAKNQIQEEVPIRQPPKTPNISVKPVEIQKKETKDQYVQYDPVIASLYSSDLRRSSNISSSNPSTKNTNPFPITKSLSQPEKIPTSRIEPALTKRTSMKLEKKDSILDLSLAKFITHDIFEKASSIPSQSLSEPSELHHQFSNPSNNEINKSSSSGFDDSKKNNLSLKRNFSKIGESPGIYSTKSQSPIDIEKISKEDLPISLSSLQAKRTQRSLYSAFEKTALVEKKKEKKKSSKSKTAFSATDFKQMLMKSFAKIDKNEKREKSENDAPSQVNESKKVSKKAEMNFNTIQPSLEDWEKDVLVAATPTRELSEASRGFSSGSSSRMFECDERSNSRLFDHQE